MKHNRWGVIYCPTEGSWRRSRRWRRICAYLEAKGQPFDFVQSEGPNSVERLAAMLTSNGYGTIIVVGGDAALGDALNGIVKTASSPNEYPRLGVIPNGILNDFARFWGFQTTRYEETIDALLQGHTRMVDVGHVRLTAINGEQEDRYFLNCINVGIAARIIQVRRQHHRFWRGMLLPSMISNILMLILKRHSSRMALYIDGQHTFRHYATLCIGSCVGFGQTPSASPYNGLLDVSAVQRPRLLQAFTGILLLFRHRFLSQKGISVWRTPRVEVSKIGNVPVSVDGHALRRHITAFTVDVQREVLPFLIP